MGHLTLEIREIVENGVDIFNGCQYPIYDESYRSVLQAKIIDHYYFREIGHETVGRFLFALKTKMNEIMPFYNKMYYATGLEQRILDNYEVTETFTKTNATDGTVDNTGNNTNKRLFSDTPQGRTVLGDTQYLTDITENTEGIDTTTTTNMTDTENWVRHMSGNIGIQTDANAVTQYVEALINVDMLVIKELNELFMGVY